MRTQARKKLKPGEKLPAELYWLVGNFYLLHYSVFCTNKSISTSPEFSLIMSFAKTHEKHDRNWNRTKNNRQYISQSTTTGDLHKNPCFNFSKHFTFCSFLWQSRWVLGCFFHLLILYCCKLCAFTVR